MELFLFFGKNVQFTIRTSKARRKFIFRHVTDVETSGTLHPRDLSSQFDRIFVMLQYVS
jgi:hypothetical protein